MKRFLKNYRNGHKLCMLTAYDAFTARVANEIGVDGVLVGDSLGMVVLGQPNTVGVEMEDIKRHCTAVTTTTPDAFVVGDLPFGSYCTPKDAVDNSVTLVKYAKANAVKLEGPAYEEIKAIRHAGIEVMAHLGMTPQTRSIINSFRKDGIKKQNTLIEQALKVQDLGCFSLVLECVVPEVAKEVQEAVDIPVIGIGSGKDTDGQIRVFHDIMGMYPDKPSFSEQYLDAHSLMVSAGKEFMDDCKT